MSKNLIIPETQNSDLAAKVATWVQEKFGDHPEYDDAKQAEIDQWGLPWFRAGAIVVNDETGKILLVHEARVQVKKIKHPVVRDNYLASGYKKNAWVDGDGGWNLPAGRLAPGESFETGVQREIEEESGQTVTLNDVLYVREGNEPKNLYIMPVYLAKSVSRPTALEEYNTSEVLEVQWFSIEGIRALHDAGVLRSPESVMNSIDAYERYLDDRA